MKEITKKEPSSKEKLLHELEIKLLRWTCYEQKPMTVRKLLKDIYVSKILAPFKRKGWFGYCDVCGKFRFGLIRDIVDADSEQDEDGTWHYIPIKGWSCQCCFERREFAEDWGI